MRPRTPPGASTRSGRGAALAVFALASALVVGIHRESPRTLVSAHGLLHTAIAETIARAPLSLPPENPFFAGAPLPYYFVPHLVAAGGIAISGWHAFHVFEAMGLTAIAALAFAAAALGRRLFGDGVRGAAIAVLVFAGASAQAPLFLAWRVARRGSSVFAEDPAYLWGLVHAMSQHLRPFDPFGMYGPLMPFFLNVTARPLSIAALLVMIAALARAWFRPDLRSLIALAAATALLASFSSLIALATLGVLPLALAIAGRKDAPFRRTAPLALALLAGVAAAAPGFWHLFAVASGSTSIPAGEPALLLRRAICVTSSAAVPFALALAGIRRAPPDSRPLLRALLLAALALSGAAIVVSLPSGNEDNLHHAALVLLAVSAAGAFARAWIAPLLFAPTLALVLACYLGRPPLDLAIEHGALRVQPSASDRAQIYDAIRAKTEANAVIVIDPGPPIRASTGNTAELPALAGRAIYTERATHYLAAPHAEMPERARIARALTRGEALSREDRARLARLGRPIYVFADPAAGTPALGLEATLGPPVVRAGALALHRLALGPADESP